MERAKGAKMCAGGEEMADEPELEVVEVVQGDMIASVLKSHLESEGIPVLLQYESVGRVYGFTVDGLGEVRILVPKELAEKAREIIKPGGVEPFEQ
jgi:hypothetical protein